MSIRIPFLFNPKSGGGLSNRHKSAIMEAATELAILGTNSKEESQELIDQYLEEEVPAIAVAGGDGTLNSVLSKFLGKDTKLGVFPSGSMNVFAREIGISTTDPDQAVQIILGDHVVETDVFTINGNPFIQMAGIGYDAHLIEETSAESKKAHGPLAYALSMAKVFGNKPPRIAVTTAEGTREEGVCLLLGNGSLYGGQFPLFKNAKNNDGYIDALLIKSSGYQAILDLALNIINEDFSALFQDEDNIIFLHTQSIEVKAEAALPYELDGDYFGREKEFIIEKSPHSLKVLAPKEKPKNDFGEKLSALKSLTALK